MLAGHRILHQPPDLEQHTYTRSGNTNSENGTGVSTHQPHYPYLLTDIFIPYLHRVNNSGTAISHNLPSPAIATDFLGTLDPKKLASLEPPLNRPVYLRATPPCLRYKAPGHLWRVVNVDEMVVSLLPGTRPPLRCCIGRWLSLAVQLLHSSSSSFCSLTVVYDVTTDM